MMIKSFIDFVRAVKVSMLRRKVEKLEIDLHDLRLDCRDGKVGPTERIGINHLVPTLGALQSEINAWSKHK